MASGLFVETFEAALKNDLALDLDTHSFKCMLLDSSWTPNFETATNKSDASGEISGTGYDTGGKALTSVTLTSTSDGSGKLKWDADDISWTGSTLTGVAAAVIYDDDTTNDRLVAYIDFGGSFSTTSGTFQIQWNSDGIFTLDLVPQEI